MKTSNKLSKFLKTLFLSALITGVLTTLNTNSVQAQEVSTGADIVSTYVWRGVAYSGPSIQPFVDLTVEGFSIGGWGSQGYDGFQEMDLYAGYSFDFGLYLGVTDYWYPSPLTPFFEEASHAFELNLGYEIDSFSLSGNYIFAGGGSTGDDLYFEAGYSIDDATSLFAGAGNGWHTNGTDDFGLVNVGVTTSKDILVTDTFTIPLSGSAIFNPYAEQLYLLVGVSF
jgi:uncharacterized protein (TIGR02001 family)